MKRLKGSALPVPGSDAKDADMLSQPLQGIESDAEGQSIGWRRVRSALGRYKWFVVGVTLLAGAVGIVAGRLIRPQYSVQATIWIDQENRRGGDGGPLRPGQIFAPEAWLDLVRSYAVLENVVRELQLNVQFAPGTSAQLATGFDVAESVRAGSYRLSVDGDRYTLRAKNGDVLERGTSGDSVGRHVGFRWAPRAVVLGRSSDIRFTVTTVRDAARQLGEALQAHIDPDGNLLKLELAGNNPQRLAQTVNAVTQRFVAVAADLRTKRLIELTRNLAEQARYAHQSLQTAEQEFEAFRARTITLPSERVPASTDATASGEAGDGRSVAADYFSIRRSADDAQRERAAVEHALATARDSAVSLSAIETLKSVRSSPELTRALADLVAKQAELRALQYRYSDAHPAVQRLQDEVSQLSKQTVPQLLHERLAVLRASEGELRSRATTSAADLRKMPSRTLEESRLRRNVVLAENLSNGLQQRFDEARVAEQSNVADVRVLDAAEAPREPVKDTALRLLLLSVVCGLGVSAGAAILLDKADPRFRYPEQVTHEMGLTILGTLPHLRAARRSDLWRENAPFVESLRAIRVNLLYAYGVAGPITLTITSPGSADGKSLLSMTLAQVFAESGRRTVIIDGDLRRGMLYRRFHGVRTPGLSEVLRGEVGVEAAIQRTAFDRLDMLSCGVRTHDAPELLGSPAMTTLLGECRAKYDVVICDSPPLGAGIDSVVLGAVTGHLLLVLRNGVSHREMTETKLEVLARMPIRLLGAVLNDVPSDIVYSYYSYHLPGYETSEERPVGGLVSAGTS